MNVGTITKMSKRLEKLVVDNAPAILTGVGVVGTVATAYLTGTGTIKATKLVSEKKYIKHLHEDATERIKKSDQELTKTDVFKLTWSCYLPAVAAGAITIGSIVVANRISTKRMAALVAGYGLLDNRFDEYKTKMQEKLGLKKEEEARAEIAQERVNASPPDATILFAEGKTVFRDEPSGRYFESTMEDVRRAENDLNRKIMKDEYAVLTDWYDLIGLGPTSISDDYGWDISAELLEMSVSAVVLPNGKPCITLDYNVTPRLGNGYNKSSQKIRAL